eukprot:206019_1
MLHIKMYLILLVIILLSVKAETSCYDASTYCANSWHWSPASCNPSLSVTLPEIYSNYCYPNDIILWKNGINTDIALDNRSSFTNTMIDYNFIICQDEIFSVCGYVPLKKLAEPSECGEVVDNSGILFGAGIDLSYQTSTTLSSLGASTKTLETMKNYYGLKGPKAAETICDKPFIIDQTETYYLTVRLMDQYVTEVQEWYERQRGDETLSFMELPLGIRTVMTSVYRKWGHFSSYPVFWAHIMLNNFENAIKELRSWYDNGATDKRLSAEANVMQASLGCIINNNMMDIVFLLDESGSVGSIDFDLAKNWVIEFIQHFDQVNLNSRTVRFGVATFSDNYTDWIYLDAYTTFEEYKTHILSISYDSGGTYLGNALKEIGTNQFIISNGMRELSKGAARLLIVLTDGDSSDAVDEGIISLNNLNLNIIAIGISSYNILQLQQITIADNIYGIDTYPDLDKILSPIMIKTCHIPTKLNINNNNNAVIQDIVIQKYGFQYLQLYTNSNENIMLNITQNVGCIYIYISYSIQYPSYFINDVQFTSCSQKIKQIVLSALNQTNIYIAIEGRNDDIALYSINISECTVCEVGTNYNPQLNNDSPYEYNDKIAFIDTNDDKIMFGESYQPSVTETPIFVVSILLGTVVLIWASLHFVCNGLDICKNSEVGNMTDIKNAIIYPERNKFMSIFSVALIIWELIDFILDLVTWIKLFVKGANTNTNASLYTKCGIASLCAFIASILLFFGKVQLWKKFYPQINEHRREKRKNVETMENIKQNGNEEFESSGYKIEWNKYYMHQQKIGFYLGDLIMYDLFGVALEDCIQITVTFYINVNILFSNENSFMVGWLWLTFAASLVSVSLKIFRALLLKLGCHHDSYRADLKPKGYELVTDLQPVYVAKQTPLITGMKNGMNKLTLIIPKKHTKYKPAPAAENDVDDEDWFSNKLKQQYQLKYDEMKDNKLFTDNEELIHEKIEKYVKEYAEKQLDENESIKNEIEQQAINDALEQQNMRMVDELNKVDFLKFYAQQKQNVTHEELHQRLSGIQQVIFEPNAYNEMEIKEEKINHDEEYEKYMLESHYGYPLLAAPIINQATGTPYSNQAPSILGQREFYSSDLQITKYKPTPLTPIYSSKHHIIPKNQLKNIWNKIMLNKNADNLILEMKP